jgi:hypothetical protein
MWITSLACSHEPGVGQDGPFVLDDTPETEWVGSSTVGPETVVPVADQEILFRAEAPYTFATEWEGAFADLDGDGFIDAVVDLVAPEDAGVDAWLQVVVRGPLEAGTSLPGDAWLTFDPRETHLTPAEITGDDAIDLVVRFGDDGFTAWIIPFPFDGNLDPGPSWQAFDAAWWTSWWGDANHDGTRDLVVESPSTGADRPDELHITWGPASRWSGSPDVILSPLCRGGDVYGHARSPFTFPGDLDGEGTPEIVIDGYGTLGTVSCGAFTVSLPDGGVIDPFTAPESYDGLVVDGAPAGDWTGDGLPEMHYDTNNLLLSPIGLSVVGIYFHDLVNAIGVWNRYWMLDADLGPDGILDVMGIWAGALVVFPVDLGQLTNPTIQHGWDVQPTDGVITYVDQGHAWAAIIASEEKVRRIDLGPAAPL